MNSLPFFGEFPSEALLCGPGLGDRCPSWFLSLRNGESSGSDINEGKLSNEPSRLRRRKASLGLAEAVVVWTSEEDPSWGKVVVLSAGAIVWERGGYEDEIDCFSYKEIIG